MKKNKKLPRIESLNGLNTLFVNDEPFILLGGEIHNSSASNLSFFDNEVLPYLNNMNMNSIVVPIYWECFEPIENKYDTTLIDGIIERARLSNLKLVFLWFGLWKNAESMYVPQWIKQDQEKYFLARKINGEPINTISPLCEAAIEKDAKAYKKLMNHIKSFDKNEYTVVMMQVENEIGLLGTERDYGVVAEKLFYSEIPKEVAEEFNVSGNWENAFGENAGEYFSAYYFAKAVEKITVAGKKEYDIPHYANAWLEQYPWRAGTYPSGGPIMKVQKMWNLVAPSIEFLAPDIYVPYVPRVLDEYSKNGNTLFVPEVRKDSVASTYALYTIFGCNGIGFSPFGIEELQMESEKIDKIPVEVFMALDIDPSAFDVEGSAKYLSKTYGIIEQLKPLYFKLRNTKNLKAFVRKNSDELGDLLKFDDFDIVIKYSRKTQKQPESGGVIFRISDDEFYIVGMKFSFQFLPKFGDNSKFNYLVAEDGEFVDGNWVSSKILNGDEKMFLEFKDMPKILKIKIYKLK